LCALLVVEIPTARARATAGAAAAQTNPTARAPPAATVTHLGIQRRSATGDSSFAKGTVTALARATALPSSFVSSESLCTVNFEEHPGVSMA